MNSMTDQLATALRAATSWERSQLNEENRGRSPSTALPEAPWLASAEKALAVLDARPADATAASSEAHIVFGSNPGKQAATFKFNTDAERAAFISGLSEANGYDNYAVVDGPDYAIDSEGVLRKFPAEVDPELPIVRVEYSTADNCKSTVIYGMSPAYDPVLIEDGGWMPDDPDAHTVSVEIEACIEDGSHYAELDGDQYRSLDDSGQFHAYLSALAKGEPHVADVILREASGDLGARP